MVRILLTGKTGQVGFELCRTLESVGQVVALDEHDLDLTSPDAIRTTMRDIKPGVVVNAAAYTAVDQAETDSDLAMKVNGTAPEVLAEETKRLGAVIVHYSTDYVFDGSKDGPYTEADTPNPLSAYGRSKLAGDLAIQASGATHFIFRTSWVYAARGKNFLLTMLRLGRERPELRIVNDQIGAPTWARFLAETTARVLSETSKDPASARARSGLYNLTASGATSWFGFAETIFSEAQKFTPNTTMPVLTAIRTADFPLPARRPANSRLDTSRMCNAFDLSIPVWTTMLVDCMKDMRQAP